jgi:excisionase family DNA binding protein
VIANDVLIETLVSIATTRSTAQTARDMGLPVETVTSRLAALSEAAGGKVYNRGYNGKRLQLTDLGKSLVEGEGVFDFITTTEAAEILGVGNGTLVNMCRDGRLAKHAIKQNGMWCIDPVSFDEFAATYDKTAVESKKWKPRPGYISAEMARQRLGYAYVTSVHGALRRGDIDGEKIGKYWYIDEATVERRVAEGKRKHNRKPKRLQKTGAMKKRKPAKQEPQLTPHQIVMARMAKRKGEA